MEHKDCIYFSIFQSLSLGIMLNEWAAALLLSNLDQAACTWIEIFGVP